MKYDSIYNCHHQSDYEEFESSSEFSLFYRFYE